ncbi:MAG: peptidase T [Janthinobacterium lividum]
MNAPLMLQYSVQNRFLKYVTIDTQSDARSNTTPSTQKQKDLGRILVEELLEIGLKDAHLDEYGYVYATLPANTDKAVPVICFCAHMDTSPDSSGNNVKPIIHQNYQGQDLVLPDDPEVIIQLSEHHDLQYQIGNDVITASGTTLLGADNKAGLAEIVDACKQLIDHPEIKHGTIKILFTPDEEIGRGVDKADMQKLAADFGYTIDGESAGTIENETFSADGAQLIIKGISAHPGFAKGKMESAIKIAGKILTELPAKLSPEATSAKEGFIHPVCISGHVEEAIIDFIIRDFEDEQLEKHAAVIRQVAESVLQEYPDASFTLKIHQQYRNMKQILDQHQQVIDFGIEAIKRAGMQPRLRSIRGGTDGSRLSFMGLPCPNIFAGEHAFHGKQEWISVQDMQKAVDTIVHLCSIWEENS